MKLRVVRKREGKATWGDSGIRQYYDNDELQYFDSSPDDMGQCKGWIPVPIILQEET